MNRLLAHHVLQEMKGIGVTELCLCPGGRNSPFVSLLSETKVFCCRYWFEERSAAFFALGRSRRLEQPVAVITTSGTAAGELLPAAMEAYYSGVPLLAVTADRPRRFRGTGAPQTAEQAGLFGPYVLFSQDLEGEERCEISKWRQLGPAHLNVCFEEPFI
ncbi:MAG: thiamine pyrophosphate-binding protein [Waddliaceae bacterium]